MLYYYRVRTGVRKIVRLLITSCYEVPIEMISMILWFRNVIVIFILLLRFIVYIYTHIHTNILINGLL